MDNELLNKLWLLIQRKEEPFIKMYVCSECRSDRIREAVMVDYNTREEIRNVFNPADIWCDVCDCETNAVRKVSNGN
jgi:hypothetical protein